MYAAKMNIKWDKFSLGFILDSSDPDRLFDKINLDDDTTL